LSADCEHEILTFNVFLFSLAFSVTLFCTEACIAILILLVRRHPKIGGELGGPRAAKYMTATALIGLWLIYLIASSLEAYGVIKVGKNA
jgi:solute carrier family 8 (sodium/calcium exchanger)